VSDFGIGGGVYLFNLFIHIFVYLFTYLLHLLSSFLPLLHRYAYAFSYADDLLTLDGEDHYHTLRPLAPSGWENQNVYFVKDPQGWNWPIGQSLTKGGRMVVFFQGTMFPGGWEADFKTLCGEVGDGEVGAARTGA